MPKEFTIDNKIIWRRNASDDISNVFYPSFYKDINKRESFFNENFKVQFTDADVDKMEKFFLPLYAKEVMSREDFTLDKKTIATELIEKIKTSDIYKFLFIFHKDELVASVLFSIKDGGLFVSYRTFNRGFDKNLSHKATVNYWSEKLIFNHGKEQGASFYSYGKDSNPYIGKTRLGLSLYKIKTGMKPRKPLPTTAFETNKFDDAFFIEKSEPILFFSNADENEFYKECYLYYPHDSINDSYLKEFEKVLNWARIKFNPISY
ncbi:MAG: hypothetical protein ACD_15C00059G0018 [uncultured bacterium]|nr:MAG: hypothetical protein ACD_15C00059G0018 [uncultured bacterium]